MAKPVYPEAFFEECRAALAADRCVANAIAGQSADARGRVQAARQAMRCLLPVFQKYLRIERHPGGVVRQTLSRITGADELKLQRAGLGFIGVGCAAVSIGAFVGAWVLAIGVGLLAIGFFQLFTTPPEPNYSSLDFNVIEALARARTAPASAGIAAAMTHDAGRNPGAPGLQGLNALIATTSKRGTAPQWIPFDASCPIGSMLLPRGGFYLGRPGNPPHDIECAIDATLDFSLAKPDWLGKGMGYWPRYGRLTSEERGTFLAFLHSPRRAAGVGIGYVFLYLYGLEHRLLRDAAAGLVPLEEARVLIDELIGLLQVYGPRSNSFARYVAELIGVAFARFPALVPASPIAGAGWTTPQRIAFAAAAGPGPLSADWAFAWASSFSPAVNGATWSTMLPVVRDLFDQRYAASPLAARVLPEPRSRLRISYRWAAFSGARVEDVPCDWPDYAAAEAQAIPYQALLQAVCEDLESMRRMRRGEAPAGAALAAAPAEIARKSVTPKLADWAALELAAIRVRGMQPRRTQEVAAALGWIGAAKLGKRDATQIAQALQALGIGMEPDPRFGGATPKPDTDLMLFELPPDAGRAPSPAYAAAHLMVTAAASIGGVDGLSSIEVDSALSGITGHFQLSAAERARLNAVLAGSVGKPLRPVAVANKVKTLPESQRHALAAVLVDIALADGHVSAGEIKLLERFYGALSLAPATLHADLHHGSLGARKEPAIVAGAPATITALDPDLIARKLEETARVQSMLAEIFVDDTPATAESAPPQAGDDDIHRAALQLVAARATLDRAEWDAFCELRDLMPDAALEALNEWSLERTGEVLLDGDDPLEVNAYARDQLALPPEQQPPA
jgi:uncharacterized tellurite resistance protein B-like protein